MDTTPRDRTYYASRAGYLRSALRFGGTLLGGWASVVALIGTLNHFSVDYGTTGLDTAVTVQSLIESARGFITPDNIELVTMGDSTMMAYPRTKSVPARLDQVLKDTHDRHMHVLNVGSYGMSAFEYYPFAARIADMRPDIVVLAFNLQSLSRAWQENWPRQQMLGWLRLRELPEAMLEPLHWWGVTFDNLLLYTGLVRFNCVDTWRAYRREQIRLGKGVATLRLHLQSQEGGLTLPPSGLPPRPSTYATPARFSKAKLMSLYGPALHGASPEHPVLSLFGRILEELHKAGIRTLVYVVPTNIEYMRQIGIRVGRGFETTLRSVERVTQAQGGRFLDLHDLLPDAGFRDEGGHFTHEGPLDGPLLVAEEIARALDHQPN